MLRTIDEMGHSPWNLKAAAVTVLGVLLVLAGLVGLALPVVPQVPFLVAGLLLLSLRFAWAYRLRRRVERTLERRSGRFAPDVRDAVEAVERRVKNMGLTDTTELRHLASRAGDHPPKSRADE